MPTDDPTAALRTALDALLPTVAPARREAVLRRAIQTLVGDQGYRAAGSKKDFEGWSGIRADMRAAMQADKITAPQLARRLGLSASAIDKASAPSQPPPSEAIINKIRAWLDGRAAVAERSPAPSVAIAVVKSGNGALPAATRLSDGDRQRLADRTEGMPDRDIRQRLGIDQDTLDRLVIGRPVPPEAIAKARAFLDAPG
jgi:hypothetical protein